MQIRSRSTSLDPMVEMIQKHLVKLAVHIGARPTGSTGNHRAGEYIRAVFVEHGWLVRTPLFQCPDWAPARSTIVRDQHVFQAHTNPYSPPFAGERPLIAVESLPMLGALVAAGRLRGKVIVLTGALAENQVVPRHFPFYQIEEHTRLFDLLEVAHPDAILGTFAGYLFCDADLHIPSASIAPEEGRALLACTEPTVALHIASECRPSSGFNVIAQGTGEPRGNGDTVSKTVVCAHYDTWFGTPGAIDNATGVSVLLGLAAALGTAPATLELVAFNGEDNFAAPGQAQYLQHDAGEIGLVINVDGIGAVGKQSAVSFYGESPRFAEARALLRRFPGIVESEPWVAGDHSIFVARGIPAIAFTSTDVETLSATVLHTAEDTLQRVDVAHVAEVVAFVRDLLESAS